MFKTMKEMLDEMDALKPRGNWAWIEKNHCPNYTHLTSDTPPHNLIVEDNSYAIVLSVPGYTKEELSVTVEGNDIFIEGEVAEKDSPLDFKFITRAIPKKTSFREKFAVTDSADMDTIRSELKDGVLTVKIDKKEKAKPKKIKIG